jgi:hypothetical protein
MVINGTAARHVEHAAQEWIKWRREYLVGPTEEANLFFVILFIDLGICQIKLST